MKDAVAGGAGGRRLRVLDLFCGEGGAGAGYAAAGFLVVGVDLHPQPRYPFPFYQGDALEVLARVGHLFDAIHASPPCQKYTKAQRLRGRVHPDLVDATRAALIATGKPYVIENVEGAPLRNPVTLCGTMFGLRTYRHRLFEASFPVPQPQHPEHTAPLAKMGRPVRAGGYMHVVGNFSGVALARAIVGAPWMSRDGLRESIPPAYTRHVGAALMEHLNQRASAAA